MRPEIGLTAAFERWADRARFQITEPSSTDARTIVWDDGGEIRYFVGKDVDGWIVVTKSVRMADEHFELASVHPALVERWFVAAFGRNYRAFHRSQRLSLPVMAEKLAAGYSIGKQELWGQNRCTLIDSQGQMIAVVGGDDVIGTTNVAYLSVLASNTVDAIEQSFLDPEGKPVFAVRDD